MALGVYGFGCEDALIHLLNYVWPNIFETSPHLVQAFMDAVEGMRVALGPIKVLQYALQVCVIFLDELLSLIDHFLFFYRAYSTPPVKYAMFTGKYTTHCILEVKTLLFVDIPELSVMPETLLSVANLITSYNHWKFLHLCPTS